MPRSNPKRAKGGRVVRCWGGFVEGRLHWFEMGSGYELGMIRAAAVYESRRLARLDYEDVRRIEIRELPPTRRAQSKARGKR